MWPGASHHHWPGVALQSSITQLCCHCRRPAPILQLRAAYCAACSRWAGVLLQHWFAPAPPLFSTGKVAGQSTCACSSAGGQFLQLIWGLEQIVARLAACQNAHFKVVFFEQQRTLWQQEPSLLLARDLAEHHLRRVLHVEVLAMDSWWSHEWRQYLAEVGSCNLYKLLAQL